MLRSVEVWQLAATLFVYQGVYTAKDTFVSAVLGEKQGELNSVFAD